MLLSPPAELLPWLGLEVSEAWELEEAFPLLLSEFCDSEAEPSVDPEPLPLLPDSDFCPPSLPLEVDFSELFCVGEDLGSACISSIGDWSSWEDA